MLFAALLIVAALVLYSTAIWSEKFVKKLKQWMLVLFISGFLCDLTGTSMMYIKARKIILNIHGGAGLAALVIMFLHLVWAILALKKGGKAQELFSRFSVYAWGVWLIAFFTGIPKR
ncbi:MAG: HsmA family protein [candidate division Zixibacteria bacterium]|nr:HsmA family protein [candidate division Zixibacteria bacterium]